MHSRICQTQKEPSAITDFHGQDVNKKKDLNSNSQTDLVVVVVAQLSFIQSFVYTVTSDQLSLSIRSSIAAFFASLGPFTP